jgi:N-acetylmuramoyl-L-alanine amidase
MSVTRSAVHRLLTTVWRRRAVAIPIVLAAALTGSASGVSIIHVHRGDTLSAIAVRYRTTVGRLVTLNSLPGDGDLIFAGQTLKVPGGASSSAPATVSFHTVVSGDTLDGIAARYHVSPRTIARRNHLPRSLVVVLGTRLSIPHRATTPTQASTSSGPSRTEIESTIRSTAAQFGLDSALALAISWQESGWNMHEISSVGAIGAMQVMPATGAFIAADVLNRPLDLSNTQDNISAGVAFLSLLTHEASSTRQAVAGYYQGLASVRQHGMFASTKQYVADVMALHQRFGQ